MNCDAGMTITEGASKGPTCSCLAELRARLRPMNAFPVVETNSGSAIVYVNRLDQLGPPAPRVVGAFCPFCGDPYS